MKIKSSRVHSLSRPISTTELDASLKEAAKLYSREFYRMLVRASRETIPESQLIPKNQAHEIFESQLYDHYADIAADQGLANLRDLIYQNLKQRYGTSGE